jgi:phospholipase/carboxylesterase
MTSRFSQPSRRDAARPEIRLAVGGEQEASCFSSAAEIILSTETHAQPDALSPTGAQSSPCGVFVPENYEPNYAYPLVVWLHEAGRSERDIVEALPKISMRNYLGLALRGTAPIKGDAAAGFRWSRKGNASAQLEDELYANVRRLRRRFHIHTERVFLVGAGEGGTMAWDLFLMRPQWFAGIAVLGGKFPWGHRPLRHFRDLSGKHALIVSDTQHAASRGQAERVGQLLYSAGLEVAVRAPGSAQTLSRAMLRHVDRWIMGAIGGCL